MPALSVIIPVYNAESYLDECLDSVLSQSFSDLEVICVDDGSDDGSVSILRKRAEQDSRILLIESYHKGPSAARNIAIESAHGRYVTFVDADDMLTPGAYQKLLFLADEQCLDVIGCCFSLFPAGTRSSFSFKTGEVMSFSTLISSSKRVFSSNDLCYCWRYIINKDIIDRNRLFFNESLHIGEDAIFMTEALAASEKILLLDELYYKHRIGNPNSVMGNRTDSRRSVDFPLSYSLKRDHIARFEMNKFSSCTKDLSEHVIKSYLPAVLDSLPEASRKSVKEVLSMRMIRESCSVVGLRNPYDTFKEYLFYLAVKFRMAGAVIKLYYH